MHMKLSKTGKDLECPICGASARLEDSKAIYGKSYGLIWVCDNYPECNCYVGCHKGTAKPLGTLANNATREARMKAHAIFDPLWKNGEMSRIDAYEEASLLMSKHPFHIGDLSENECYTFIDLVSEKMIKEVAES